MTPNEIIQLGLSQYIYGVKGQPFAFCGGGMICSPNPFNGSSIKNGAMPIRFVKFWIAVTTGAAGTNITIPTTTSIDLFSAGVGDTRADAPLAGALLISDTNLTKGGSPADTGNMAFITGLSFSVDQVVSITAVTGAEVVPVGFRPDNQYFGPLMESILDETAIVASSDNGCDARLGVMALWPSPFGPRSGNRTVSNGMLAEPGHYAVMAHPISSGDKNDGSKLSLTLTTPRARSIQFDAGAPVLTADSSYYVKGTCIIYMIQVCGINTLLCGPGAPLGGGPVQTSSLAPGGGW